MKHPVALSFIWLLLLSAACNKSKDEAPLSTVTGQSNSPFVLKKGQMARIATSVNDIQLTLTGIDDCVTNGIGIGQSSIALHVTDGSTSEDLKITIPKCSFQQGDSLASSVTKGGKIVVVNSVEYENIVGSAKGLKAKMTVK